MAAQAEPVAYKIDPTHSEADFSIRHLGISNVHGRFGDFKGTVVYDEADLAKSSVDAVIDVSTVNTGVEQRDAHLKTADFFDAAKYPTMTFKSKSVKKDGDGFDVDGDLTLHGVTKPVTLKVEATRSRGFEATTTINRKDYGLNWNGTLKSSGDAALGDDVKIEISLEGGHQ